MSEWLGVRCLDGRVIELLVVLYVSNEICPNC